MRFVWDRRKAASNLKKHGVSFEEARDAVLDPLAYSDIDEGHGDGREWLLGRSNIGKTLFVVLLEVEGDSVRIISARHATAHERRLYEG